jgi:hypothetical protein
MVVDGVVALRNYCDCRYSLYLRNSTFISRNREPYIRGLSKALNICKVSTKVMEGWFVSMYAT